MTSTRSLFLLVFLLLSSPLLAQQDAPFDDGHRCPIREAEMKRHALLAKRAQYVTAEMDHYDVQYYRLDVTFPSDASLPFFGSSAMHARSVVDDLTSIDMHFAGGTVDSVFVDGTRLPANSVTRTGDVLSLALPVPLQKDETTDVIVHYRHPYGGSAVTIKNVRNVVLDKDVLSISTQSEPYDARTWWPCKDDPADKADSIDVVFTVDTPLYPVSNGLVVDDTDNGDGTRTVHWKSRYPIVTYLISVAASEFNFREFSFSHGGKTMPVGSWWYGMSEENMAPFEQSMLDGLRIYSNLFIPYPYMNEKYGMAEYEWGGAMEHQTVSSMGFYSSTVVVHELMHQWFGDKVTCASFEHIWLNEGWATYGESLFYEALYGFNALKADMAAKAVYRSGTIYVQDPETVGFGEIFSDLTYEKASWVLHMLRHIIGDEAFFEGTRNYLGGEERGTYRSVTTAEFQQYMEDAGGMDLDFFFQQWIFGEYYPTYKLTWESSEQAGAHDVSVTIDQLYLGQRQLFTMPIDLYFRFADGSDTSITVWNDEASELYAFTFEQKPSILRLDPDGWILKKVIEKITNPTFDNGILVVNGVDWDVEAYTPHLKAAFADSVFTGGLPYTLWDIFPNPDAGYPDGVPTPIGSGPVPANVLGQYCIVVWLGNAYNGDDAIWQQTSAWEYVKAGGNLVLMTRYGREFVTEEMRQMLGINWRNPFANAENCVAQLPSLVDMSFFEVQNWIATFSPVLQRPENDLLFTETVTEAEPQGLGVWAKPITTEYGQSGHVMFLSLRPYYIQREQLKQNMDGLLRTLPCNPVTSVIDTPVLPNGLTLDQQYPNPVTRGMETTLQIAVDAGYTGAISVVVYDLLGRMVLNQQVDIVRGGSHIIQIPTGAFPAGVYSVHLKNGSASVTTRIVVLD
ncbi:MAG: T9SS type A sorting domain-containing protein [Bacteroidetes bacterium]|nr:T9SS type A sorting domain-containing protein [Bacteroidota bacterium]